LVTSDGGIDCSADPEFQEQNSAKLKESEYLSICDKLAIGGNGVLKLFSCCHPSTLMILESAANSFDTGIGIKLNGIFNQICLKFLKKIRKKTFRKIS